ncbi:SH3 domain-containing protein [Fibrella sp. HMF5335]|uniref:SH3 domain-containing protein n=1 Tax=Fibrella rubiginis TaxID=2817060 RepID=A0A939GEV3_9BACT|nr:SH3 domain-containing protein [Fibrella rubiginis]MBO0935939.1 SH3 domain-containing protein [Fibrella rubiginis]
MQALHVKIFLFLGVWGVVNWYSTTHAQTPPQRPSVADVTGAVLTARADSLYRLGQWAGAAELFESALSKEQPASGPMLLKLARAYEQQGDVAKVLYYLQVFSKRNPDEAVLRKMNDIARVNSLSGYETSDLNYFYLFYRQYGIYLTAVLLLLGMYVFGVLLFKSMRREETSTRLKTVIMVYLVTVLIFINLPEGYESGITSNDRVYLRTEPSAAAPVVATLGRGNKVNILSSRDIWWRIFYNNGLYYIRKDAVWLI